MPAIRRWTAAEVREMQDESRAWPRYELLIGGELVVTPGAGNPHQVGVFELADILREYTKRESLGVTFGAPTDLELLPDTVSQPDLFVVPYVRTMSDPANHETTQPAVARAHARKRPKSLLLAVEFISPSSVRVDRVKKREHYMAANVPEYWIVDIDERCVERWTPSLESPDLVREILSWHPASARAPLIIDLPTFFDRIEIQLRDTGLE